MSEFDTGIARDEPFDRGDVELVAAQITNVEVARLLLAAPDLLEACKAALDTILAFKGGCNIPEDCVKLCGDCQCVVPSLRAATKLAEGQQ